MTNEHKNHPQQPQDQDLDRDLVEHDEPPPQTWKHPDDGKSLSERDEEWPLKP